MTNNNQKDYPLNKVRKFSSIKELVKIARTEAKDRSAFQYKSGDDIVSVTYDGFADATCAVGQALYDNGFIDTHIATVGENSYNWVLVYLSVLQSDNVFVPVDKDLPEKDMLNVLNNSDATVLFYAPKFEQFITDHKDELPNIKTFIGFGRDTDEGDRLSFSKFVESGRESYKALTQAGKKTAFELTKKVPEELKMIVYTSGTTGNAKGVMLSEKNMVSCVYYGLQISTIYTKCLSVLPYHHTYEAVIGILVSMHKHATICINDSLRNVAKNLQLFKPDYIIVVPAMAELLYNKVWAAAAEKKQDKKLRALIKASDNMRKVGIDMREKLFKSVRAGFGGNLKKIVSGGAPIRPEVGEFFDSIGIYLCNGYGITECSPLVSVNRDFFNDYSTAGVKIPCIDVKIINPTDTGEGEICVKGDTVMMGYYKNPEATAAAFEDGWFKTGDYGRINEKNQIIITGRKKNIIVLANGKNVYPEELEEYISRIPYVNEVIVSSFKDDLGNESALCAEIFPDKKLAESLGISNLVESAKKEIRNVLAQLPSYKQISKVIIRDKEFDKTSSRKIKRNYAKASSAVYDITGEIKDGMWSYEPPFPEYHTKPLPEVPWVKEKISCEIFEGLNSQTGTYLETPAHYFGNDKSYLLRDVPVSKLTNVPAIILYIDGLDAVGEGRKAINAEMLEKALDGRKIPDGAAVIVACGWGKYWFEKEYLSDSPYFTLDAMNWLVSKKPFILSTDFPRWENLEKPEGVFPVFYAADVLMLAPVAGIEKIADKNAPMRLTALPLAVSGTSCAPCRAVLTNE